MIERTEIVQEYFELLYRLFFVLVAQFQGMAIAEYFVNEIQETVVLSVEDVDDADGHFLQFQGHRLMLVTEGDVVAEGIHQDIEAAHFRQTRRMFHQVQGRSLLLLHLFRIVYPNKPKSLY